MDRAIPEVNRHIMQRMRQENRQKHKSNLRATKPSVDNALPESMYHPIEKKKKEQMIEGKQASNSKVSDFISNNLFTRLDRSVY